MHLIEHEAITGNNSLLSLIAHSTSLFGSHTLTDSKKKRPLNQNVNSSYYV